MNLFRAISNLLRFDRTNWKALALCIFAAAIFWIFNALNKNYSTNVSFPLQFEFDNAKYIPVEPLPATLILNVSGNGWELFRKSLGLKVPNIALSLERPVETRKIVASTLSPVVAGQIGSLTVNYIVSDTLRLKIETRISRKIKLMADLKDVTFKNNFGRISSVVILPDSILIEGPKSLVEKFTDSMEVKITASRIDNSYRESVEIAIPYGDLIKRNPPVAEVIFDVGPMEEVTRSLKLNVPRMSSATEVDRDSVQCIFLIPQKEHDRFQSDISTITASLSSFEIKKGETKLLLPFIQGVPAYVKVLHTDSVKMRKY